MVPAREVNSVTVALSELPGAMVCICEKRLDFNRRRAMPENDRIPVTAVCVQGGLNAADLGSTVAHHQSWPGMCEKHATLKRATSRSGAS